MKLVKRLYRYYLEKWNVGPVDLVWIALIFAITGLMTVYLRGILTPFLWGDYRGWGYYATMPLVFIVLYYSILLLCGMLAGYREVFIPMVKRPLFLWQKIGHWLRRD